ncbi:hypothetical protein [Flavobacterium sp.]|uniref:hypothetical protein n=1 Tax=Flavobacterium sp. TaxID=239 RepID=UPI002607E911|nr:hypothetical protein [Flavobacterium sp.]
MIINKRNKKPKISFGLGKSEATINVCQEIFFWQTEIIKDNSSLRALHDTGITITKINNSKFKINATATGVYKITISNGKRNGNSIKLTVV